MAGQRNDLAMGEGVVLDTGEPGRKVKSKPSACTFPPATTPPAARFSAEKLDCAPSTSPGWGGVL
ncbi:hypothetical protein ACFU6I_13850 [Streptomyces sp. NPDC057486]|uniref:hypothetical protein n=1 Tax=Streptomyces sp. NPDC057486 TaxID=3346145 RepID=UPI003678B9C2